MIGVLERARLYVSKCEPAVSGQRGHDRTFHVASCLVNGFALDEASALTVLREYNQRCVPQWSESELLHKVKSAAAAQHAQARGYLLGDAAENLKSQILDFKPSGARAANVVSPRTAAEKFLKGFRCGEADLAAQSPVSLDGDPRFDGALALSHLYNSGELVNFVTEFQVATDKGGESKARPFGRGMTLARDAAVERFSKAGSDCDRGGAWLRMNPVDGKGVADANVAAFRFALLESDALPLELQLSVIARLPLPIVMVLSSGGRSVHAWVKVDCADAESYRATVARMLGILARLGFDEKNKNPSRLSRLPGARREIGGVGDGLQRVLYLNPNPGERSICP